MRYDANNKSIRKESRQPPPNYFSRSTQVRLLMMVFSLLLIIMLMFEARKPENWRWIWASAKRNTTTTPQGENIDTLLPPKPQRSVDPPGTVYANTAAVSPNLTATDLVDQVSDIDEHEDALERIRRDAWRGFLKKLDRDERNVLARVLRNSRGGPELSSEDRDTWAAALPKLDQQWQEYLTSANNALLVAGDELPAEQRTRLLNVLRDIEIEWTTILRRGLRVVIEDRPWTELERDALARLQETLDELAMAAIRDDMVWRPEERTAWFRSFEKLLALTDRQAVKQSLGEIGFVQLFRQPNEYRGRLVTVKGTAELAYRVSAPKNDLGIESYYVFWLRPGDGSDAPVVVYALELPDGFPEVGSEHTNLRERLTFTGYFFKRWAYGARDGIRTAPLILAKRPTWEPAPPILSTERPSPGVIVAAILAVALLAIAIARWVYRANNSRGTPRDLQAREPTSKQFASMAEEKIGPTITESLQQRSERDQQG